MGNAPLDTGGGALPNVLAHFLRLAANQVQKIDVEDVVSGEIAEKIVLFDEKDSAVALCLVLALVACVVAEHGIGLNGKRRFELFGNAVCAVRGNACAASLASGEYGEMVAFVTAAENYITVAILLEFESYLVEYCCNVVSAHALEVGQE